VIRLLLALLLAGCGGGDDCTRNVQDESGREQAQWVERCPTPAP
jgi:hypothetical protein